MTLDAVGLTGGSSYYDNPQWFTDWNQQQVAKQNPTPTNDPYPDPQFGGSSQTPDDLLKQFATIMGIAGYGSGYGGSGSGSSGVFTPQEKAQRGLAQNALQQQYLSGQVGLLGQQGQQNTLFNQLTGQDIARLRDTSQLKALQDAHTAQGQFAANGSATSDMARQTLGSVGRQQNYAATGGTGAGLGQAWMGNGKGDIANALQNYMMQLYSEATKAQSQYSLGQQSLYGQLLGMNVQQGALNQSNDMYNRVLSGQVASKLSPEDQSLAYSLNFGG